TNAMKNDSQNRCKRQSGNTCFLTPEGHEGPFYWNSTYNRANMTEDRQGIPLILRIKVIEAATCQPIPKAAVDIWHCDVQGVYSHFLNSSTG
ncbi:unnamed protein product, partial [Adineta steineri]